MRLQSALPWPYGLSSPVIGDMLYGHPHPAASVRLTRRYAKRRARLLNELLAHTWARGLDGDGEVRSSGAVGEEMLARMRRWGSSYGWTGVEMADDAMDDDGCDGDANDDEDEENGILPEWRYRATRDRQLADECFFPLSPDAQELLHLSWHRPFRDEDGPAVPVFSVRPALGCSRSTAELLSRYPLELPGRARQWCVDPLRPFPRLLLHARTIEFDDPAIEEGIRAKNGAQRKRARDEKSRGGKYRVKIDADCPF